MNLQRNTWYAVALAAVIVGALAIGVPTSTLLLLLVVLACPVMMMFMMGGHGHESGHDSKVDEHPESGRRQ